MKGVNIGITVAKGLLWLQRLDGGYVQRDKVHHAHWGYASYASAVFCPALRDDSDTHRGP